MSLEEFVSAVEGHRTPWKYREPETVLTCIDGTAKRMKRRTLLMSTNVVEYQWHEEVHKAEQVSYGVNHGVRATCGVHKLCPA